MSGGASGGLGLLGVSLGDAALARLVPGATIYVDPLHPSFFTLPIALSGAPGAFDAGHLEIPVLVAPGLVGANFYHQVAVVDVADPTDVKFSNGLLLSYGE